MDNNVCYYGDCLDIMKKIPDKSIDMVLCDLPYGVTNCKWDIVIPLDELWDSYKRIVKDNGAIVLTASQPFTSALVMSNLEMFKYSLVWNKRKITGFLNAKKQPLRQHEDILIFYKKQCTYNPQMHSNKHKRVYKKITKTESSVYNKIKKVEHSNNEYSYPRSIIEILGIVNNSKQKLPHPSQKPLELFEYLIKTYSNENDIILDNCAGSFTTAIACIHTNRKYICIENNIEYFKLGENRINNILNERYNVLF